MILPWKQNCSTLQIAGTEGGCMSEKKRGLSQAHPRSSRQVQLGNDIHLCLILRAQVRVRQAGGHVEHEGVVKLAHLVSDVDILAASLDDDLRSQRTTLQLVPENEYYADVCLALHHSVL